MKVREVKLTDSTTRLLNNLDSDAFPGLEPYPKEDALWWISVESGVVTGFAGLKFVSHSTGFLCRVGVLRNYRGKGTQKQFIKVRETRARKLGWKFLITYTSHGNLGSANSLIACGFKLYDPVVRYGVDNAMYFIKEL